MPKYINQSQITGEKGVAAFHRYCTLHSPFIIFREESKNDFGIDGEIEFTYTDANNKKIVTGEIVKIQIKSTEKGSYISNETNDTFAYKASKDDLEYWKQHKVGVILVIYDVRIDALYARIIKQEDYALAIKSRTPLIQFNKTHNLLQEGDNQFNEKYQPFFKSRVNYDVKEVLYTNLLKFDKTPRYVYKYKSKLTKRKDIFDLGHCSYPIFGLNSSCVFSFEKLDIYKDFKADVLVDASYESILLRDFLREKKTKNIGIELINRYFRSLCSEKGLSFNNDYKRFYFAKQTDNALSTEDKPNFQKKVYRKATYQSKRNLETEREVVTWYNYYDKTSFFRHMAFEVGYSFDGDDLYMSITPKYLFTQDGRAVLDDKKKVTKYTNYKTAREFNQQVLNHIYFIVEYLSDRKGIILAARDDFSIILSDLIKMEVPFGIAEHTDTVPAKRKKIANSTDGSMQTELDLFK